MATCCFIWIAFIDGCRKDELSPNVPIHRPHMPPPVLKNTYTEEFAQNTNVMVVKGWVFINLSTDRNSDGWHKDFTPDAKSPGVSTLSPAYSDHGDPHEFAYVDGGWNQLVNKWMLTPPVELKNGDKISFYTKMDPQSPDSFNLLEIRLNPSDTSSDVGSAANDVGRFTLLVGKVFEGYPKIWTKKEFILSGINGTIRSRIALRYYPPTGSASAIGVDVLKFEKM